MYTLNVEKRTPADSVKALMNKGFIPAVFYGPKEPSTPIAVSQVEFTKVWKKAGESSIITLKVGGEEHDVLIHDLDFHPLTDAVRHVDFYVIEKGKKLTVDVPISFTGTAPAVKDLGGILVKVAHEIKIKAMPKDLPREISVDITALSELTSVIKAGDLKLPQGVEPAHNSEDIIASVAVAKEEVEEAPTAIDMSAIEVEKKGKEEPAPGEAEAQA